MFEFTTALVVLLVGVLLGYLHLTNSAEKPKLFYKEPCSPFINNLIRACPILTSVYNPTYFWGHIGHWQTIVHAKMGRINPKWPCSRRVHIKMPDEATMSYDIFEPYKSGPKNKVKFTLAICPGIANSSESIYIRTFASYAKSHSYRVAVLNHLGALKSEPLTSPRIFTYGGTHEYSMMIDDLRKRHPEGQIVAVGFSMGGNIVCKYLGENPANQQKVLCGLSICQGYEIVEVSSLLKDWVHLRRMYSFAMTMNTRRMMARHSDLLFSEEAQGKHRQFDKEKVFSATCLGDIDENYSYIKEGFPDVQSYYKSNSCAQFLHNITIPMFLMNALDDPICPVELLKHARNYIEKNENSIFVTTKHGGHLGYFEGGTFVPDDVTWLDRFVIEYADAITDLYLQGKLPSHTGLPLPVESSHQEDEKSENQSQEVPPSQTDSQGTGNISVDHIISQTSNKVIDVVNMTGNNMEEEKEKKKRGSLKRGIYLQQTTSYVQ